MSSRKESGNYMASVLVALCLILILAQAGFAQTYYVKDIPGIDAYAAGVQRAESAHFRIVWGNSGPQSSLMTTDYVNGNLTMLENMWTEYYVNMGFKEPRESLYPDLRDGRYYKENLYVLMTGVPGTGTGGGAFCGFDGSTGFAYGLLEASYLRYSPPSGATPHEFGHFYENHAGGMHDASCGAWWECTANWMMLQFEHNYPGPGAMITMPYYYPGHGRNYYDSWQLWEYYKQATGYGESFVNRIWTQGTDSEFILNAAMRLDTSSNPDKLAALKNCFGEVAKRAVTWDYTEHGSYFRTYDNWNMNLFDKYQRGAFAQPSLESGSSTWYRCPWEVTPNQFGYVIIPLAMPGKTGSSWTVTCNFKGLVDATRGSDWRACLVTVNDSGTARYSSLWSTGNNSITLSSTENKLYLTVAATPSVQSINGFNKGEYRNANKAQFPFEFTLTNAQAAEYAQTRPGVPYHTHTNGGGWVANTATVDSTAYVGPNATVQDTAQVRGYARVEDYAVIKGSAQIRDYAKVTGHATVAGSAIVQNYAKVRDYAYVFSGATVSNDAKVIEHANADNAKISGNAVVKGTTYCWQDGTNTISGDSIWDGDTAWGGNTSHGIVFDWLPSAPYTTANPSNLYCQYTFQTTNPIHAWDEYGVTHGYLMGSPSIVTDYKVARGNELQLNGSNQWVELRSDVSDFRDITIAVWAYTASTTTNQRLVSFGDGGSKQMYITPRDSSTGNVRFVISDGSTTQYINGTAPLMTNGWQHVAVTLSGNTGKLFVNGALVGTNTSLTLDPDVCRGANTFTAGCKNYIGRGNTGNYFNGKVDDFRVYSNAQADATIATLGAGGDSGAMVAFYQFENNVTDTQGAYNGTAYGTPTYVTGKVGTKAINFNGTNQYVTINRPVSTDFTIAFYVKTTQTSPTGTQWWSGKGLVDGEVGGTTNDFGISYLNSKVAFGVGNADTTIQSTSTINSGYWTHVACTRNSATGQMKIYINGVLQTTGTGPTGAKTAPTTLHIGNLQTNLNYFAGAIDQLKIFSTVLNDADIATLATEGGRNIPQTSQLLFSAVTDTFPASGSTGAWASYLPAGQTYNMMNTPIVETISSKKWEQNRYADGDGYDVGTYSSSIACTGASIVVAIRPTRTTDSGNWRSVVDIFYDRLVLGVHNNDGIINVRRNGSLDVNTTAIPNNQLTVLSLVCQSDGKYKVWANGTLVMDVTTTSTMTSLVPGVAGAFANHINIGRNNPDGWTVFNGNIGDVFVYKTALTDADRQMLEYDIRSKFGF